MTDSSTTDRNAETDDQGSERPPELQSLDPDRIHDLDVREQLRRGEEPFERIMSAVSRLAPGDVLRLRAIFEPEPLYGVLKGQGFRHWTEKLGDEDWRVWFYRPGDQDS